LPFNRAYYERHGYELVPDALCEAGIRAHLDEPLSASARAAGGDAGWL
jgi:hypothetical protein